MNDQKTPDYGDSMWAALDQTLQQAPERLDVETLERVCARLIERSEQQQTLLVRNSGLAGRLQVSQRLIEIAEETRFGDLRKMLMAAKAAVTVSASLGDEDLGALAYDARAEAWGCLANALRIHGDMTGAERAWAEVAVNLRQSSGDPLLRGKLLEQEATLHSDLSQFDEAQRLFQRAQRLYESVEDRHLAGRTLLSQGNCASKAGDYEAAIRATLEGGKRIDIDRDPRMRAISLFNLAYFMGEAGRPQEALELLRATAPLCDQLPNGEMHRLRHRWKEGRLQATIGLPDDAARTLEFVRDELIERELPFEAALASLDLAAVYAELGLSFQVAQLARDMLPIFESSQIPREASAALLLFAQAAREQTLTAAAIRATARKLRHQQ